MMLDIGQLDLSDEIKFPPSQITCVEYIKREYLLIYPQT